MDIIFWFLIIITGLGATWCIFTKLNIDKHNKKNKKLSNKQKREMMKR